jgi:outer membrane protein TolC
VSAAQEALRVAQSQLRAGIVAEVFVTEAETVLARAQTDTLNARFEAARSRARLAYAAGIAYPETVTAVTIASANE